MSTCKLSLAKMSQFFNGHISHVLIETFRQIKYMIRVITSDVKNCIIYTKLRNAPADKDWNVDQLKM